MRTYNNAPSDKVVINCSKCLNKLRVPTNVGKVSVTCPVCKNEFQYNPNSLFTSLKYAGLFIISKLPKDKKTRLILLTGIIIIIIAIWMIFATRPKIDTNPSPQLPDSKGYVMNYIDKTT